VGHSRSLSRGFGFRLARIVTAQCDELESPRVAPA
jgi:hypothetical protein